MKAIKRLAAALLAVALSIGMLAGCAKTRKNLSPEEYQSMVIATYGDTEIKMCEVNYYLRNVQFVYEAYYSAYYGPGMWTMEVDAYTTMEDSVKEMVMNQVFQTYVLAAKAEKEGITLTEEDKEKVKKAVEEYLKDEPETLKKEVALDKAALEEIYTLNALANKGWELAVKDTNTEVKEEDAAQRAVKVFTLKDDSKDYVAKDMKDAVLAAIKDGKTIKDIEKDKKLTAYDYTLGKDDYKTTIGPTAMKLKKGEAEAVYVESSKAWYVVYCESELDEKATENKKQEIIDGRKAEEFKKVYKTWKEEAEEFVVNEDVLKMLTMKETMYVAPTKKPDTEGTTEEGTTEEGTTEEGTTAAK